MSLLSVPLALSSSCLLILQLFSGCSGSTYFWWGIFTLSQVGMGIQRWPCHQTLPATCSVPVCHVCKLCKVYAHSRMPISYAWYSWQPCTLLGHAPVGWHRSLWEHNTGRLSGVTLSSGGSRLYIIKWPEQEIQLAPTGPFYLFIDKTRQECHRAHTHSLSCWAG